MNKFIKCLNKTPWLAWIIDGDSWYEIWKCTYDLRIFCAGLLGSVLVILLAMVIINYLGFLFLLLTCILIAICVVVDWSHFDSCIDNLEVKNN